MDGSGAPPVEGDQAVPGASIWQGVRRSGIHRGVDPSLIEAELRRFFAADPRGATTVYLYGSVARGTAGERSDVDVAVLYGRPPPRTLEQLPLRVEEEIEKLLGMPAQVVVLDGAPPDLIHRVLRDGKLLLDRDPSARIRFEVKARNEFFDLELILRRYRKVP